jgi:hypothetical protein
MRSLSTNVHNKPAALTVIVALLLAPMIFVTPQTNGEQRPTKWSAAYGRDVTSKEKKRKTVNAIFRVTSAMPNEGESLILIIGHKRIYRNQDYQSYVVRFRNIPCGVTARLKGVSSYEETRWETRNSIPIIIPCNEVQFNGGRYYLEWGTIKRGWVRKGE